ncbi:MAG: C1 family peptidase, partial [Thermodesulfobacteriota bacterium]
MKKILLGILGLFLSISLMGIDEAISQEIHPIMHPDRDTHLRWIKNYETAPKAPLDAQMQLSLTQAADLGVGTPLSLLNYLQYTPSQRNQGMCGNCWVWAGTGMMEIALNVQNGIKDRLSIQFLDSCKTDSFACNGGDLTELATWYGLEGYAVPWSNVNAFYQDSSGPVVSSPVSCSTISTTPEYPFTPFSISSQTAQTIPTTGVGQATAIVNIKNILNQNKGVWFGFWLANTTDWNSFHNFWSTQPETAVWVP